MVGWAGGKLLCSPVDSSPGKLLGEVASFSAEVLSLEWSKLGWGENRDMDFWPQCIHPRSGPVGVNQCAFFSATFTLLGMRGRCPSCPRTLGLSSGLFSLWSSSSLSLPASSGKTREQAPHLSPCSVDSEASRSSFFKFQSGGNNLFAFSFQKLQVKSAQMGCSSTYNMPTFLHFLPLFSANLQIWILIFFFFVVAAPSLQLSHWPLNSLSSWSVHCSFFCARGGLAHYKVLSWSLTMASSVKKCRSFSRDPSGTTAIKSLSATLYLIEVNLTNVL